MNNEIQNILDEYNLNIEDLHNIGTMVDVMTEYTTDIDKKKINLGFPQLHAELRGLRVQELLTVIAASGIGKSALALNFLLNFARESGELVILFSLEMSTVGIAERIFQIELNKYGYEIEEGFVNSEKAFIQECKNLDKYLGNFIVVTKRLDIHQLPIYVELIEKIKGRKARLIGVDYIGLMDNHLFAKDEYARITDNMKKLYAYSKDLDVGVVNLSQTSRADIKGGGMLTIHSGKGSGEVENSSDFVVTLELVPESTSGIDEGLMMDTIERYCNAKDALLTLMRMVIQKNRRQQKKIIHVVFNRKNLIIKEYCHGDYSLTKPITDYEKEENLF